MESNPQVPRRRFRYLTRLTGLTPLVLGAVYCGISLLSADILTRSHMPSKIIFPTINPNAVSPDARAWSVRTEDGVTLRGWYFPTRSPRRLVVLVHGLRASWFEVAGLGRDLHELGYDVLMFDLRGHGRSDPSRVTMGRRERRDVRAALNWAKTQGFTPERIGWVGFSMGAATVLMEGAENPELRVAVVDSPFGDLPAILDDQLARHSNLPRCFNPGILAAADWVFGVRTSDLVPIRSARRWSHRPLLLIHGDDDQIVPVRQARLLAQSAGDSCRMVILPGVEHVQAYQSDPEHYVAAVDAFFQRNLAR